MEIDPIFYKKMVFIYGCLNQGWTISQNYGILTLSKKHKNNRKYYNKKYLQSFMLRNFENLK